MKRFILFLVALAIWVLLVLPLNIQSFTLGIMVALLVAMLFGNYFIEDTGKFWELKRWAWFLYYIPVFAYYMILANLDVMYRVLHPLMPINPGIVKVRTRLKSKSGRAALCNSITLTPGTLTVDICGEYLYIHWINVKSQDTAEASRRIVEKFENILEKVFE